MAFACAKDPSIETASDEMVFRPFYPGTKASDSGFEVGDSIGIYVCEYEEDTAPILEIAGCYASNIAAVYDGLLWACNPKVYWNDGRFDIYAYYPYCIPSSIESMPFSVQTDQNSGTSDFLWAKVEGTERTESVALAFKHCLCKIRVNLIKGEDYEGDLPEDIEVYIHNTVIDANINLATGSVEKNSGSSTVTIKAKKRSNAMFDAIVVPQRLDNSMPLIEVCTGAVSYMVESSFVFRQGMMYNVNITLDSTQELFSKINIGGEISDWD